jgi:hypothetical protein
VDFIEAADNLRGRLRALYGGSQRSLANAERIVSEGPPGDGRQARLAELELASIAKRLDEALGAYDLARRKLGYAPRYANFLDNRRVAR